MRKIKSLILIVLTGLAILISCTTPTEKIKGDWYVDSIAPQEVQIDAQLLDSLNSEAKNIKYSFLNDSVYMSSSLLGSYIVHGDSIRLIKPNGKGEDYIFSVTSDSLVISGREFMMRLSREKVK